MLKNPFLVFIATFGSAIVIYRLDWSDVYPTLTDDFLLFFTLTFVAAGLLARFIQPFVNRTERYTPGLLSGYATLFVVATFAGEVALARGLPLWFVARGANFYQTEASAAHLHAFTFWSVFSAIRFADFLYSRRNRFLVEAALPVIFYVLLVYRGPAIMCVLSWIFILAIRQRGLRPKQIAFTAVPLLLAVYVNGVIGDIRSPGHDDQGAPSAAFRDAGIPHTFFWTYLYATAPLANFQLAVSTLRPGRGSLHEFASSEFLPDTLSKRIMPHLDEAIESGAGNLVSRDALYSWTQPQIAHGINIASLFGRSYGYFGWIGPIIMFLTLSAFIMLYVILIRDSPYRVPALALLNVLVVFCLFNNMLASAAMLPQLVWPLLLPPWIYRGTQLAPTQPSDLTA